MDFSKIAPYLQDPLVLVGFVLLLFFGLGRALLKAGIIPVLTQKAGYQVVSRLLLYGFLLGLAVVLVGFGLKYRELSAQEQRAAVRLLNEELVGDINVAGELKKNTETILNAVGIVSGVMRTPGIKLLPALFPADNLDPTANLPASLELARTRLEAAQKEGLLDDPLERDKFNRAGAAISGTITRTLSTVESLSDLAGTRYVVSSAAWDVNLPILRKVNIVDASQMQGLYIDLARLRTNYGVVVAHCIEYLKAVREFFAHPEIPVTVESLAQVLAAERLFLTAAVYARTVEEKVQSVEATRKSLAGVLGDLGGLAPRQQSMRDAPKRRIIRLATANGNE
jgi:hypothetical protein